MASRSWSDAASAPREEAGGPERWSARRSKVGLWLLGILAALAVAWTMRETVMVTLPLACALFVALSVAPVSRWVRHRTPRGLHWLGHLAAMLLVAALLAAFVAGIALAAQQVVSRIPTDPAQLQRIAADFVRQSGLGGLVGGPEQLIGQLGGMLQSAAGYAASLLSAFTSLVSGVVLIFFLTLLMLVEAPTWHAKLASLSRDRGRHDGWDDAVTAIGQRFRTYFLTRMLLGAITGLLYAGWLSLFGVDLLLVWGLLAFLLNFVPTVGSLIAGLLPVLYVFATRDTGTALIIGAGILVIEQVMGNYVDPRLLGKRVSLSSLVVLVSLLLWSWIWGIPGALLAVPMTVLLMVVFAHVPALQPIALLLSDEPNRRELEEHVQPHT